MQTMAPPEDATAERFARLDERFGEVNRRITEGREETNRRFDLLSAEMKALRQEMTSLHATVQRGNYTLLAAMLGLIGTILIKGG
ncbi:MAG TPA: hypothetical protein VFT79_12360 [Solirubrobacterales bacterium]|nr:hypothetical protein [Solirubrobacterales bacterium]